jgi:hypothetical protein
MAGRIRDNQEIPRAGTVERDTFVRDIARLLLEGVDKADEELGPKAEQFIGGIVHYLMGRIHDRADAPREQAIWRGKAPLVSLMHGVLVRQRETMGNTSEALCDWLDGMVQECETGKYNPLAIRAFKSMSKLGSSQSARILDLAERSLRLEMGLTT